MHTAEQTRGVLQPCLIESQAELGRMQALSLSHANGGAAAEAGPELMRGGILRIGRSQETNNLDSAGRRRGFGSK